MADVLLGDEQSDAENTNPGSTNSIPGVEGSQEPPINSDVEGSQEPPINSNLESLERAQEGDPTNGQRNVIGYRIEFAFNSDEIAERDFGFLAELANMMRLERMKGRVLVVEGHTDSVGSSEYNLNLSIQRATAVVRHLVEQHGIGEGSLKSVGKGESEPLDGSIPEEDINRRVQFYLE
ncbi:MAG: OmpA family protein [Alphaproteobacteria bacterium]